MTKNLYRAEASKYGDNYREHLLDQYKLYVESVERTSDRRNQANNYCIAVNSTLIGLLGLSLNCDFFNTASWIRVAIALIGLFISAFFWYLIRSYKQLNTAKFKVIHEIEESLPLGLYSYEWKVLGQGKHSKLYIPFSHIELLVPIAFGVFYIVLIVSLFPCSCPSI
jgi:hypothetical protein